MRMAPRQEVTFHGTEGFIKLTAPFNPMVYDKAEIIQRMNDGTGHGKPLVQGLSCSGSWFCKSGRLHG